MGRACLKERLKGVKVRFRQKNMLDESRTGICFSLNGAAFGHRHPVRASQGLPARLFWISEPIATRELETVNGSASAIVTFNQRDFAAGIKGFSCAVIVPAMALQQIRSVIP